MTEEINSKGKTRSPPNKFNTKGCCFLCLQIVNIKTEAGNESTTKPAISLGCVRRYLKIELPKHSTPKRAALLPPADNTEATPSPKKEEEIEVDLCTKCKVIVRKFSNLFLSLEKIQMEIHYWLERIHQQISQGSKKSELVQNYSKRMTSDPETLTQLVFVDNFRKKIRNSNEISDLCQICSDPEGRLANGPKVELSRLDNVNAFLKHYSEKQEELGEIDNEFEEEFISDTEYMIPSSSPQGATEEDVVKVEATETEFTSDTKNESNKTNDNNADSLSAMPLIPSHSLSDNAPQISKNEVPSTSNKMYNENSQTGTFDCVKCLKQCKTICGAQYHYKSIHLGKRYTCELCGGIYSTNAHLNKHKPKCNGIPRKAFGTKKCVLNPKTGNFRCVKCKAEFTNWETGFRHSRSCVEKPPKQPKYWSKVLVFNPETKKYGCVLCKKEYINRYSIYAHHRVAHLNMKYVCDSCGMDFKYWSNLMAHKSSCKDLLARQEVRKKYKFCCQTCNKKFSTKKAVENHNLTVHLNQRNYGCDLCEKTFKYREGLKQHKETVHFGKKFTCKFCKKEFNYSHVASLYKHERNYCKMNINVKRTY